MDSSSILRSSQYQPSSARKPRNPLTESVLFGPSNTSASVSVQDIFSPGASTSNRLSTVNTPGFQAEKSLGVSPAPSFVRPPTTPLNTLVNNTTFGESSRVKKPPLSSSLLDGGNSSVLFDSAVKKTPLPSRAYTNDPMAAMRTEQSTHETQTLPTFSDASLQSLYGAPMLEHNTITPTPNNLEVIWSTWILVHGYNPSMTGTDEILKLFQQFGEIVQYYVSSGNWMLIKYRTAIQSDRATSKPCLHLNNNTLLSISKMNVSLAKDLQITLGNDHLTIQTMDTLKDLQQPQQSQTNSSQSTADSFASNQELRRRHTASAISAGYQVPSSTISSTTLDNAEPNIYLLPKRKKNICERMYEYFWSY